MDDVFVLLDDCDATDFRPSSRLYTGYVRQHVCRDPGHLDDFWRQLDAEIAGGLHAALFVDYEWGARLIKAGHETLGAHDGTLRVLLFNQLQHLESVKVGAWLKARDGSETPSVAGVMSLTPTVDQDAFEADIGRILELISAGETYQVNYTYRLHARQFGSPVGFYRRLLSLQPVSFGCLAALPALEAHTADAPVTNWVLSCSPELFVRNESGRLITRPMKGTAPRERDAIGDDARGLWLSQDPKNLAENVMIVDLLRNDLGRISQTGSVKVPKLFALESYRTVHQLTSTVESQIRPKVSFPDVLRALFPCGSVTGTPKVHTMDLIARLETTPRGLYCGAIGWVDPATMPAMAPDFCLSVAIRTMQLGPVSHDTRAATLGVGGGVVIDSTPCSEFDETRVKARFLTQLDPGFTLFETLLLRAGKLRHLSLHMARLQHSAAALGFKFEEIQALRALQEEAQTLGDGGTHRVRLDLHHGGMVTVKSAPLEPFADKPVALLMAPNEVPTQESALLAFKTSLRSTYDAAIRLAIQQGAFDALFVNPQGMLTEGGRSSVFVKLQGRWYTPSLESGVLPGVMRSRVLALSHGIIEREIHGDELAYAQALAVCNALRGVLRAVLRPV